MSAGTKYAWGSGVKWTSFCSYTMYSVVSGMRSNTIRPHFLLPFPSQLSTLKPLSLSDPTTWDSFESFASKYVLVDETVVKIIIIIIIHCYWVDSVPAICQVNMILLMITSQTLKTASQLLKKTAKYTLKPLTATKVLFWYHLYNDTALWLWWQIAPFLYVKWTS